MARPVHDGDYFVGFDVSSSGTKALAYDPVSRRVLGIGRAGYRYENGLGDDYCELSQEVMMRGLLKASRLLRQMVKLDPRQCKAIGVGGAMHGANFIDAAGNPLHNILCWDDPRGEEEARRISEQFGEPIPHRFTVARWLWMHGKNPTICSQTRFLMTPATYAAFRGCGLAGVMPGDAAGMCGQLAPDGRFDMHKLTAIDPRLPGVMPRVGKPGEILGTLTADGAKLFGFPEGTPLAFPDGDQPLGTLGKGCVLPGSISIELGSSVVINVPSTSPILDQRGLIDALYTQWGSPLRMTCVTSGANALNELVKFCKSLGFVNESVIYRKIAQEGLHIPPGCDGAFVFPFFGGEGSLLQPSAFGTLIGLRKDQFNIGVIGRSIMEASCFLMRYGFNRMGNSDCTRIILSGGGANSQLWRQIVADMFGIPVTLSATTESVAFGAALLALATQTGTDVSLQDLAAEHASFGNVVEPNLTNTARYEELLPQYIAMAGKLAPFYQDTAFQRRR